jgi:uncharacterized membrane protein
MTTPGTMATDALPYAAAAATAAPAVHARSRIAVIDVLRGLAIAVMLLGHVRENFFAHVPVTDPIDINATPTSLYFTRVLAHFAAPVFVFLTGLGAWLYANPASGAPRSAAAFLIKRGMLLVFLELTVINFAWYGQFPPATIFLQVIWVIGLSMIALGLLHRLPRPVLAVIAFALVFGHNLLSPIHFTPGEVAYLPWLVLHDRGFLVADGLVKVKVSYPLLPWIGVILLGYLAMTGGLHRLKTQRLAIHGRRAVLGMTNMVFNFGGISQVVIRGNSDFAIDTLSFNAGSVPEPATWAMMIGGFAFAGAAMRRRTAKVAFTA